MFSSLMNQLLLLIMQIDIEYSEWFRILRGIIHSQLLWPVISRNIYSILIFEVLLDNFPKELFFIRDISYTYIRHLNEYMTFSIEENYD